MLNYVCVCLLCSIVVNLALSSSLSPMLNLVYYVWLYYSWFFVFNNVMYCPAWQRVTIVAVCQLYGK